MSKLGSPPPVLVLPPEEPKITNKKNDPTHKTHRGTHKTYKIPKTGAVSDLSMMYISGLLLAFAGCIRKKLEDK